MKLLQRLARAAVLALALLALPALATPALWEAHSGRSTMYLFGTVHLLPGHTGWRSPELDKALADSGTLYIEITDDDPVHVQLLVLKYGTDLQQTLSSRLNPGDRNRLQRAARIAALPGGEAMLEPMKPWLAALTLSMAPLLKAGLDPKSGVDKQLKAQFEAAGKPVKGLETAEEQIRFFADMQPKTQLVFLRSVLKDYGHQMTELRQLVAQWDRGDVAAIDRTADLKMRKTSPAIYQRLIAQRNRRWGTKLADIMKTPGTYFVAVGAAHLAGPDSVQKQLQAHGIEVRRVQ
jgi:uncharacterized protein